MSNNREGKKMTSTEWKIEYCADSEEDSRTRGRAYYVNMETGETRWREPEEFSERLAEFEREQFQMGRTEVERLTKPLRWLMRCETSRDARVWINARDLLHTILKNITEQPNEGKYRKIKKKFGGKFVEDVWNQRFARELLIACGFMETSDSVELKIVDDTNQVELNKCRLILCRLQVAIDCRDRHVRAKAANTYDDNNNNNSNNNNSVSQRHLTPNIKCSNCTQEIESGARRLWTTDALAPKGEYSFKCSQCENSNYILCERCWDKRMNGEEIHLVHANFEHLPPIESRHNTSTRAFGRGPWGNFAGASVGNARERLRQRTGL
jgi:hypothetical protein